MDKKIVTALRWFSLLAWLGWLLFYWQGGRRAWQDVRRAFQLRVSVLDPYLMLLMAIASPLLLLNSVRITLQRSAADGMQSVLRTAQGTALTLLGIAGTFYCRLCLGRYWQAQTEVSGGQSVVDCGPYAWVRHPIYSSALVLYAGTFLVFFSRLNQLLVNLILAAYVLKTLDEDRFLADNLPGYQAYQWRVPYRLAPGVF